MTAVGLLYFGFLLLHGRAKKAELYVGQYCPFVVTCTVLSLSHLLLPPLLSVFLHLCLSFSVLILVAFREGAELAVCAPCNSSLMLEIAKESPWVIFTLLVYFVIDHHFNVSVVFSLKITLNYSV